jgi:nodulation protein E
MIGRRVAVTGLGVVSALGLNRREFWSALCEARCAIAPIERVDVSQLRFEQGAEVRDFDPAVRLGERAADALDRFAQFALVSALEATDDAGIEFPLPAPDRCAVVTGSSLGGKVTEDAGFARLYRDGKTNGNPSTIPRAMTNASASAISMTLGTTGPAFTLSTACSSASHAIGLAFSLVRDGRADLAIAGGSEAPFTLGTLKAWEALRVIAPDTCRPFSESRRGTILGEGGAMLVLEPLDDARARGAHVYTELAGFGMNADAHHVTKPSPEGPARAMLAALADADLPPDAVGYVNAHGTGTPLNDELEAGAIRLTFGAHADRIAVSSTKSAHGHTLGAAGAIEAVATVLTLDGGIVPATLNHVRPDPACGNLDVVPNTPRATSVEHALSSSFAFGGLNAVLAFSAADRAGSRRNGARPA